MEERKFVGGGERIEGEGMSGGNGVAGTEARDGEAGEGGDGGGGRVDGSALHE